LLDAMFAIRRLVQLGEDQAYVRASFTRLWNAYMQQSVRRDAEKDAGSKEDAMDSRMQNVNFLLDRFFTDMAEGRRPEDIIDELSMMVENKNTGDQSHL